VNISYGAFDWHCAAIRNDQRDSLEILNFKVTISAQLRALVMHAFSGVFLQAREHVHRNSP